MVRLTRIYTRTGDKGRTRLASGEAVDKFDPRVEAYGDVDETNACLGLVRLHLAADPWLDAVLGRAQNELFDLGADLATAGHVAGALRILPTQVERLEREIDAINAELAPLGSFILPGGSPAAAALHLARTVCRRAERRAVSLAANLAERGAQPPINPAALKYLNRLSDLLFVACRRTNANGAGDILWSPGATREP